MTAWHICATFLHRYICTNEEKALWKEKLFFNAPLRGLARLNNIYIVLATFLPPMVRPSSNTVQPKKRLVICCDGTWNNSVSSNNPLTNVSRISRCIEDVAADGVLQIVYYHTGIGSGTSRLSNSIDGAVGRGNPDASVCMGHLIDYSYRHSS